MIKNNITPPPWRMVKCKCGDPICDYYQISIAFSEGRFRKPDAQLIIDSHEMRDILEELYRFREKLRIVDASGRYAHTEKTLLHRIRRILNK